MKAAFSYRADVVELDIHPTTDGHFAVFHDWRLECRTNGTGVTREQAMSYLKTLDVGYGYTADSGRTFPFRGRGVGLMPSLDEVLATFPDRVFLINIKSNDPREGAMLAMRLSRLPVPQQERLMVYGGDRPISVIRARMPHVRAMSRRSLERSLVEYVALGWSGHVPGSCAHTLMLVPIDVAGWLWGWPDTFLRRMHARGTVVVLVGKNRSHIEGFDRAADLETLPPHYSGGIWTDRIDLLGPALARRYRPSQANLRCDVSAPRSTRAR